MLLNLLCAALYITASAFLSFSVFDELIYEYETEKIPAYPAMKSVYVSFQMISRCFAQNFNFF